MAKRALVTGASGFIGNHLVKYLRDRGYWVRGVDWVVKKDWAFEMDDFQLGDLREEDAAHRAMKGGIDEVYALAADMGGMGFISQFHVDILQNNTRINLNTLYAAKKAEVERYFYSSSACCYPEFLQESTEKVIPLREVDAFPAMPQDAYGWEKLFTEVACHYYRKQYGMTMRIARFHNIAGPLGTWRGGREKAPAAMCRKVAEAKLMQQPRIDVWGDGTAVRSYCYIDDCLQGIDRIMHGKQPELDGFGINLGSDEAVTVDQLAIKAMDIAEYHPQIAHVDGPIGVAGRNSDNTLISSVLGWAPSIKLDDWLPKLYQWVEEQVVEDVKC